MASSTTLAATEKAPLASGRGPCSYLSGVLSGRTTGAFPNSIHKLLSVSKPQPKSRRPRAAPGHLSTQRLFGVGFRVSAHMGSNGLRKRKQDSSPDDSAALLPSSTGLELDELDKAVPGWAEPVLCGSKAARRACMGGECELLHLAPSTLSRPCRAPPGGKGLVVVCAGPERSGSTWLFNAVRLMLQATGERVHSYWIQHLTQKALQARGLGRVGPESAHLVVKTHHWSDEWDPSTVDAIFLTERDVVGVVRSYLRVGWLAPGLERIVPVMEQYVEEHQRWKAVASAVIPFEAIADVGNREVEQLERLGQRLLPSRAASIDYRALSAQVASLPVPLHHMDLVTKLWPKHLPATDTPRAPVAKLSDADAEELQRRLTPILAQEA